MTIRYSGLLSSSTALSISGSWQEKTNIKPLIKNIGKDPGLESLIANFTNPTSKIYDVAVNVLAGEIAAYGEDYERAVELLEAGVKAEKNLNYSEPSAWHIPVRQTLGSVLMRAEMPVQAE